MKVKIKTKDLVGFLTSDISIEKFMAKYNLKADEVKKIMKELRKSKWRID